MTIVSDNDNQFIGKPTRELCENQDIHMRFASVEHPQTNRQDESAKKILLTGICKRLADAKGKWLEELPAVM